MIGAYKKKSVPTVPAFNYQDTANLFRKRDYDSFGRDWKKVSTFSWITGFGPGKVPRVPDLVKDLYFIRGYKN